MASPEVETSTGESLEPSQTGLAGPSTVKRTIKSFFGGSAGEAPTSAPIAVTQTKRKRKKVEGPAQGKLGLGDAANGGGSSAWTVERPEATKAGKKGRGKGRDNADEDAELKEMVRKAREAEKAAKKVGRGRGRKGNEYDSSYIGDGSEPQEGTASPKPSPAKRKRASKLSQTTPPRPPPDIVNLVSSDSAHSPLEITITGQSKISPFKNRTSHPFFARVDSRGAVHDPIDVDTKTPPRRKLVFAADQKQVHGFFGKGASRGRSVGSDGESVRGIVDVKGKGKEVEKGKVHAFFTGNGVGLVGAKKGWGRGVKEGEEWAAPLPGGVWPSHVGCGYQYLGGSTRRRPDISLDESSPSWSTLLDLSTPARPPLSHHPVLAKAITHPAIDSLPYKRDSSNRSAWTERYRPTRACEVLGNETEATYLRDWLSALSIGGTRKVVRKVRKPKYTLIDDWIVDDAGVFGGTVEGASDVESEMEEPEEQEFALGERPDIYPDLSGRLTNTILLTGKSGVGKSAAVYAAASELGWEVFEVNPGMGRRTGGNLMSWVGDVGRNHMVNKGNGESDGVNGFFGRGKGKNGHLAGGDGHEVRRQGWAGGSRDLEENDRAAIERGGVGENGRLDSGTEGVRQSLILIDEVDILFNEENTFWPSVISLIAESRRPVVLICNDSARVPVEHLPLQTTLHVHPPSADLAIAYLTSLAEREGLSQTGEYYTHLYTCSPPDVLDIPLPPNGNEPVPHFDLRRAITQMQLDRDIAPLIESNAQHSLADELHRLDAQSYVDAHIQSAWIRMEMLEIDRHRPTLDDEMGIHMLLKPDIHDIYPVLASSSHCGDLADALISPRPLCDLPGSRAKYIRSLLPLLDPLIPLSSYLLPHPSLFVDVMPVLREIVEVDDVLEAEEKDAVERGLGRVNRKTGRPKRVAEGYVRYLDVGGRGVDAARRSGFG